MPNRRTGPDYLAMGQSFDIDPSAHKKVNKGAKMHNKTRGNPSVKEVEMIKKMLGGPQLPQAKKKKSKSKKTNYA
tara:strand:+ start:206 stop:430 length:225 start_codon:yes stop_codon:yes gene_type:complete